MVFSRSWLPLSTVPSTVWNKHGIVSRNKTNRLSINFKILFIPMQNSKTSVIHWPSKETLIRGEYILHRYFHLSRVDPPCVPYLGLYLSDLTFIEESSQDISEKNLINFSKMRMVKKRSWSQEKKRKGICFRKLILSMKYIDFNQHLSKLNIIPVSAPIYWIEPAYCRKTTAIFFHWNSNHERRELE